MEKKLELDRRLIKDTLVQLGRELEDIEGHRSLARTQRMRSSVPVVAIVGYTNAGKIDASQQIDTGRCACRG